MGWIPIQERTENRVSGTFLRSKTAHGFGITVVGTAAYEHSALDQLLLLSAVNLVIRASLHKQP